MDPNEKLTGIASMMQPPQGAPMGPPPGMGGGAPAPMGPPPMPMGAPMPPEEPPMEPEMGGGQAPMSVEQDAMMLAEAVVGRTQGDIGAAVDVLDTAKAMLISSGNQEPQMMSNGGGILQAVPAGKKGAGLRALPEKVRNTIGFKNMGGPLYAKDGQSLAFKDEIASLIKEAISPSDADIMRQMIMDDINKSQSGQSGRGISDEDIAFMLSKMDIESGALGSATNPSVMDDLNTAAAKKRLKDFVKDSRYLNQEGRQISRREELGNLFRKDIELYKEYTRNNPKLSEYIDIIMRGGKALSDEDAQMLYEMGIKSGEIGSATNPDPLDSLPKRSPMVPMRAMAGGGSLMTDAQKYREAIKQARMVS
tara:strand:+ start:570 stop:1664 length:1095 start_codon:yes stop_codon:yes gene_type:complete